MKIIKTFYSRAEAEVAKSMLDSEGIESIVKSDDQGGVSPAMQLSLGVNLMVDEEDYEIATQILGK